MTVECPVCAARGTADETKLPQEGRQVICPRCGTGFMVQPERSSVAIIQQRERMVCPACGCEQPKKEACEICGIVIEKYLHNQVRQQEKERLEFAKLRSATREVDAWYKNLFDRRLSSLIVRVMTLLVLTWLFLTCSMNSARRNRYLAENAAEMRKAAEGGSRDLAPEKNDALFRERFGAATDQMIASTDACLSQNYQYKASWIQGTPPYFLSESLADNLSRVNRQRHEASTALRGVPSPSTRYQACYIKANGLSLLNKQVCDMANAYATHIHDFNERLSNFNFEFSRISREINECKDSLK